MTHGWITAGDVSQSSLEPLNSKFIYKRTLINFSLLMKASIFFGQDPDLRCYSCSNKDNVYCICRFIIIIINYYIL